MSGASDPDQKLQPELARGIELAPGSLLERIRSKRRVIAFALPDSAELRYLDIMRANANCGGAELRHIILRSEPRKIEAIEEFLHGTHVRNGLERRPDLHELQAH